LRAFGWKGFDLDKRFVDKASGKDTKRPQLEAAPQYLREGDVIVVHSVDCFARNLDDVRKIVTDLTARGVVIELVKEHPSFTSEDSAMSKLFLSAMGAFAEFERALLKKRLREGIALAKKAGVYKGRKPSLTDEQAQQLRARIIAGEKKVRPCQRVWYQL
jgi:DNA invertase Pin-like site-specific DNA recombinase